MFNRILLVNFPTHDFIIGTLCLYCSLEKLVYGKIRGKMK